MFTLPRNPFHTDPQAHEVSLHPAHLTDSQDRLLPASLIPFCSYQGEVMGKDVDGLVACDKFQPTVLEGQMCYSLDLVKIDRLGSSKTGMSNGLLLVLDSNTLKNEKETAAKIYLDTLFPFTDYRNGSYAMSSLKKMTGTKRFLSMLDTEKKCQVGTLDGCKTNKYLSNVQKDCNCVIWALQDKLEVENFY